VHLLFQESIKMHRSATLLLWGFCWTSGPVLESLNDLRSTI